MTTCTCGFGDRAAIAQRLAEREAIEAERDRLTAEVEALKNCHGTLPNPKCGCLTCTAYVVEALKKDLAACSLELNRASHELGALKLKQLQDTTEACAAVEQRDRAQKKLRELVPLLEKIIARAIGPSWQEGDDPMDDAATSASYATDLATINVWAARALDIAKKEG